MSDSPPHAGPTVPESFASQFERVSGLSQWMRWAVIMGGVCVVLLLTSMIGIAIVTTVGIYLVILTLFGISLAKSYGDVRFLDRETKLASKQVGQLAEYNDIAAFLEGAEKSVFRSHIQSLYTIFLAHPDIRQDNLIEVLHSRLMARNRVVELFASILITVGLIGTIVGLIQTIGGLSGVISSSKGGGASIAQDMMASLGGLDTAFYTTLLGAVFGGVVLRILTSVVDASIMRYSAHIAELTEVNVLPAMRRIATRLDRSGYYERLEGGDPAEGEEGGEQGYEI